MLNAEYPHLQVCYEDVIALQAARDADVVDRLLDPGRESFTRDLHALNDDILFYQVTESGKVIERTGGKKPANLARTIATIDGTARNVKDHLTSTRPSDEKPSHQRVMTDTIQTLIDEHIGNHRETLHTIFCLGLIAGQFKPHQDRLEAVWEGVQRKGKRKPADSLSPADDDTVYRCAVTALKYIHETTFLRPGEEETIAANIETFRDRIHRGEKVGQSVNILNRYDFGRMARRTLELVMRPSTSSRDTRDEIAVLLGHVRPPIIPEPTPGYTGPIVELPWPILPPPERKRGTEVERPPEDKPPRSREPRIIVRDELRTAWLGMLATRWPFATEVTPIDLHSIGEEETSEYDGAFLYGPDNVTLFAVVGESEIAIPHNSMHAAVAADLHDARGYPVSPEQALGGGKKRALSMGSKQFNHTGLDTYKRVVDHLKRKFHAQYGYPLYPLVLKDPPL